MLNGLFYNNCMGAVLNSARNQVGACFGVGWGPAPATKTRLVGKGGRLALSRGESVMGDVVFWRIFSGLTVV